MGLNAKSPFSASAKLLKGFRSKLSSLASDIRGSTSAMMTAAFIPILITMGGAVDLGRAYIIKSQMQTAVDAAVLASAQSCKTKVVSNVTQADTSDAVPQATAYFNDNFTDGYMGSTARSLTQNEMCTGTQFMRVRVTGSATMPYTFGRLAGLQNQTITATATAETSATPATIEAVMVLDVTGSMTANVSGGGTRIAALQAAAKDFVDVLYQSNETQNKNSIALGIVPYNITVNLGSWGTGKLNSTVEDLPGFTSGATGAYAWAGCVMSDSTIQTMSSDLTVQDAGAWDISLQVPGIGGSAAPKIKPFFYPPSWIKKSLTSGKASESGDYYIEAELINGPSFQDGRYKTDDTLAQTAAYKNFYFETYKGLNNGSSTASDDVIVAPNGSYYDANAANAINGNWKIVTSRIPRWNSTYFNDDLDMNVSDFPAAGNYGITNLGVHSPNQQCPAAMETIQYGRTLSDYTNWINANIIAMRPGAGTIHHAGMLWGYRMLLNTTAFPRNNITTRPPKRVILFMTDGNYESSDWSTNSTERQKWADGMYSLYGRINDKKLADSSDPETIQAQSSLRFSKICEAAKGPATVYIVAFAISDTTSDSMFSKCAPGTNYKKAATKQELREAFQAIAREIVDLHIVS